jgi:Xaa-Pro aminopeptidase
MADSGTPAPTANANRSTLPTTEAFSEYMSTGWADADTSLPALHPAAPFAAVRRARLSALHPNETLVIPAGDYVVRSNDTDFPYRAHSAFAWLSGWGSAAVPGSVLIFTPGADGHDITLYLREAAGRGTREFFANAAIGEFWTGPRPSLEAVGSLLGLNTRSLTELPEGLDLNPDHLDPIVHRDISELRLIKDDYEIAEMRAAVAATHDGFSDVIAELPRITAHERGERLIEGVFNTRARVDGNAVGYDTIAASGPHACTLHWTRNDGPVLPGDLVLIDAGVERDSYYTADITRTLPAGGTFTPVQRDVYEAVREAADAALAVVRPGIRFHEVHAAAMEVIARRTAEWGFLPVSAEESLNPELQYHRRYMVHGTSHHLGIDVHDCAQARRELYLDGVLEPGMVFTIEPGLYFQPDDLTVPEEFRGIGVRIEDDIVVTETGAENLSAGIPRTADDVEAWLAR